jgi:hypothetical protein
MKVELLDSNTLYEFREHWTGERILDLIADSGGKLLVNWSIGIGKSHNIDDLVEAAIETKRYDLVVVLLPTRRVLNERRWIQNPPPNIKIVNLRPRPSQDCGAEVNEQWKVFEQQGMALYGRSVLCDPCPNYQNCFWPDQCGRGLLYAQVVYATQTHLEKNPTFIAQLKLQTNAKSVLVILDEVNFISKSLRRKIKRENMQQFVDILERLISESEK